MSRILDVTRQLINGGPEKQGDDRHHQHDLEKCKSLFWVVFHIRNHHGPYNRLGGSIFGVFPLFRNLGRELDWCRTQRSPTLVAFELTTVRVAADSPIYPKDISAQSEWPGSPRCRFRRR